MWTGRVPASAWKRPCSPRRTTTFIAPSMNVTTASAGTDAFIAKKRFGWRGVSMNGVQASPSVKMNFHDSSANHHAAVVRQYPKKWKPSGSNQGGKENQKNDNCGGNDGR